MRTSPAKSADQGYSARFPRHSECRDHEALSADRSFVENDFVVRSGSDSWSASDRRIIDLVAVHSVDVPATATTEASSLQDESAVRMPNASQLSVELPSVAGLPRVTDAEIDLSHEVFLEPETWVSAPPVAHSRYSFSDAKLFLIVCMIAAPIVFVLAFASARFNMNLASMWAAWTIDRQGPAPAPLQTTVPSTIEPLPIPVTTVASSELPLSRLQGESPRPAEAQESSTSKADPTASMPLPNDPRPAMATPQAQGLSASTEAEGIVARSGPDPEIQTPRMQASPRLDTMPTGVKAHLTAAPSTPANEEMTIDNGTTDLKSTAMPDAGLSTEASPLREAQAGVWTYCAVNLIPSGQIAVHKAMTYQSCISAGKKCAGPRRYADIQFFDRPTLTSKVPLDLCDKEN
jgi:hypothetical protein